MINDVTELRVYQRALHALDLVYALAKKIPRSHDRLYKQITSAAESVPAQIAEGFGKRRSPKEFLRFLEMALGSSDEVISHCRSIEVLAKHYPQIRPLETQKIIDEYHIISKQLNVLRNKWVVHQK